MPAPSSLRWRTPSREDNGLNTSAIYRGIEDARDSRSNDQVKGNVNEIVASATNVTVLLFR